jgi:hypothetical protein
MKYLGKAVMDEDENYGIVLEYKKMNISYSTNYQYRIYYPKDGYDDWFTASSTKIAVDRLEKWRKYK